MRIGPAPSSPGRPAAQPPLPRSPAGVPFRTALEDSVATAHGTRGAARLAAAQVGRWARREGRRSGGGAASGRGAGGARIVQPGGRPPAPEQPNVSRFLGLWTDISYTIFSATLGIPVIFPMLQQRKDRLRGHPSFCTLPVVFLLFPFLRPGALPFSFLYLLQKHQAYV